MKKYILKTYELNAFTGNYDSETLCEYIYREGKYIGYIISKELQTSKDINEVYQVEQDFLNEKDLQDFLSKIQNDQRFIIGIEINL